MAGYKNHHVLSECLLSRFMDGESKVFRHAVTRGQSMRVPVDGQGYGRKKGLWRRISAQAIEDLWNNEAERHMYRVFASLDAGRALTLREKQVIVRFLAVHYVRSNEFIRIYETVRAQRASTLTFDLQLPFATRYDLRLKFLAETGTPSAFFEETMLGYYRQCLSYLTSFGLEIGTASGDETFILPDGGLFLADVTGQRVQPSGGVSLLEATYALMPLGPRHIAAFTSKARKFQYRPLFDREVCTANENLKLATIEAYYSCVPGGL
jgi:hypothetical protein